jgi:hypothetical protein
MAFLVGSIESRDLARTRLARDEVGPSGFHIRTQRGYQTKTGYDDTTHSFLQAQKCNRPSPSRAEPVKTP